MPSKIEKFLRKLDAKRRAVLAEVLDRIIRGDFAFLDMKKLEAVQIAIAFGRAGFAFSFHWMNNGMQQKLKWIGGTEAPISNKNCKTRGAE